MSQTTTAEPRVDFWTKVAYGFGSVSEGVKYTAFNVFLLFYFNQVLGLSGTLSGLAVFLALCFDAVTDPFVGSLSDNTHSRWGRRHPFMYAAALPMALCFYMLFSPPAGLGQMGLFAWLLCFSIGVRGSMTLYHTPSSAMVPELTDHYDERTTIVSYRHLFSWSGGLGTSAVAYLYFFAPTAAFERGQLDASAYPAFALGCAIVVAVAILVCSAGTHHTIPRLRQAGSQDRFSLGGFARDVRQVLANHSYRMLLGTALLSAAAAGFREVVGLHMKTYFWGFSTAEMLLVGLGMLPAAVAGFFLAPRLAARSDKRLTAIRLTIVAIPAVPAPIFLRLMGLMPENGTIALLVAIAFHNMILVGLGMAIGIVTSSMLADVVDEGELRFGKRQEGMFSSAIAFVAKATHGLGGLFAGIVLDVIAFPRGANLGQVPPDKVFALGMWVGPGLILFYLGTLYFTSRYRITRARHAEILAELDRRRVQGGSSDFP